MIARGCLLGSTMTMLLQRAAVSKPPFLAIAVATRLQGLALQTVRSRPNQSNQPGYDQARAESADKDSLLLFEQTPLLLLVDEQRFTRVQAYTAGYERELPMPSSWLKLGAGGQVTAFIAPDNIAPVYGNRPWGMQLFLRMRLGRSRD